MKVNVKAQGFELTDAIREYAEKKFSKLHKVADNLMQVSISLSHEGRGHKAEASFTVGGLSLHCKHAGDDLYAIIDELEKKAVRMAKGAKTAPRDTSRRKQVHQTEQTDVG